jgi:hypothetical protein
MKSYRIIIEEKARQAEFMRKLEIEKIIKEHTDRLNRMEQTLKNKN